MILEIQHETRLEYSEPASESVTELRMEPVSDEGQSCHSYHLAVSPSVPVFRYEDGFGNPVRHFGVLAPHRAITILSAAIVETHPRTVPIATSRATFPLAPESLPLDALDFLPFRGSVRVTPLLRPVLEAVRPRGGTPVAELVLGVASHIHAKFEYAPYVTLASSPVDEVLEKGKGVCQDFAHLMIALLRSLGVPARYASGYIHRPNRESQSHAWCEAWIPDVGWVGVDPTNDRVVDEVFVKVAVGRDFTDVPPNKGVCRTRGKESIFVRVETRDLDRLPSLSWQEQLPPLHVPLQEIVGGAPRSRPGEPDSESQQQ